MITKEDLDFVKGNITQGFSVHLDNETKTVTHVFKITKGFDTKEYSPNTYLRIILENYYKESDNAKKYQNKLNAIVNAESKIFRLIDEYDLERLGYNFNNLFRDIEIQKNKLQTYYETESKQRAFRNTIIATVVGVLLGLLPMLWQKDTVLNPIVLPKIQIVHDTVYLNAKENHIYNCKNDGSVYENSANSGTTAPKARDEK